MKGRTARHWRGTALLGVVAVGALAFAGSVGVTAAKEPSAKAPALRAPPGKKLGFVVTYFYYAMYQGPDACPKGMQPIQTSSEFLKKFSPEERARLLRPENTREVYRKMAERGPNGENVCKTPWAAPDPQMYTLSGDLNDGLDLDGSADASHSDDYTCPHKQYVGSDGQAGVDNQIGRILACTSGFREKGTIVPYFTQVMRDGMWSMLIDISGVDDVRNDPDVTVDFYTGDDTMVKDPSGKVLAGASLAPKTDPKFHRQVKGRIKNGVLETVPIEDLVIPDIMLTSARPPMRIERPRLKLTLQEDGNAKGFLGGYVSIKEYTDGGQGDASGEAYTGVLCNGMYYAAKKYADGAKNPKTGQCEALSASFRMEAVPAFIVHPGKVPVRTFAKSK
jgi:hypothetical protein